MSIHMNSVSFMKKLSLIFRRKAYLIYTDNPIPSLLIPLPETDKKIKSSIYRIFSDLTNNEILTFHNQRFKDKDLNNMQRQQKAKLVIDQKYHHDNINLQHIQNVQVNNESIFLTATGEEGILKFMSYEKIKENFKNQMKKQNQDELMNVEKEKKRLNQDKQKKAQGNVQSPSVDSRKQAGMPYENPPYSKQPQTGKPSTKKPSFGTVQPEGKSQQNNKEALTKPQSEMKQRKQGQGLLEAEKQAAKSNILDIDNPPRCVPNQISIDPQSQPYRKVNRTQNNIEQPIKQNQPPNQRYENYCKSYDLDQQITKTQKIIPLALLTDNITTKPINIIHIQTSKQYLFLQVLKIFCLMNILCIYRLIKDGTREENHDEIRKTLGK